MPNPFNLCMYVGILSVVRKSQMLNSADEMPKNKSEAIDSVVGTKTCKMMGLISNVMSYETINRSNFT